ncbi:MAG TPA: hypothetical protein VKT29_06005 [Terriglobales bacterium]|nr:hypothetical protein [Terriglobales bacterium]
MSSAHIHLILNHIPVMGIAFAAAIMAFAMLRPSSELKKLSLVFFVFIALAAIPTYLTGEPAEKSLTGYNVPTAVIERHEEAAGAALAGVEILGVIALAGLVLFRRTTPPQWFFAGCLAIALAIGGIMAWTANLGGQIRHPEISTAQGSGTHAPSLPSPETD